MKTERKVLVDGVLYPVILSDEQETLLAAKAAGRVFVGLAEKGGAARLWGAEYVAEAEPEWERENNQKDDGKRGGWDICGGRAGQQEDLNQAGRSGTTYIWSGLSAAVWDFRGEFVRQNVF